MTDPVLNIHDHIDATIVDSEERGRALGVVEGRKQVSHEVNELIQKERDGILEQGREEGRNAVTHLIEEAREQGRVGGVVEGRALAESTDLEKVKTEGYRDGHKVGNREGYKVGRGEGYKNGWNDAITTPARDHKPK
tara:strand:- start:2839 stop:3249 length:411 start_codon:yes stop_codon:yes gene_type:complete